jgi:hypothetical protein
MAKNDDEKLIAAAAADVVRAGDHLLHVEAKISTWFDLIAIAQLGLRHPGAATQPTAQRSEKFLRALIEQIDPNHGNIWRLLNFGFYPDHDQP